jgi:hypothetical protein
MKVLDLVSNVSTNDFPSREHFTIPWRWPNSERIYPAKQDQHHANRRREFSHQSYRMTYDALVHHVFSELRDGWTPEEIAGQLPQGFPGAAGQEGTTATAILPQRS